MKKLFTAERIVTFILMIFMAGYAYHYAKSTPGPKIGVIAANASASMSPTAFNGNVASARTTKSVAKPVAKPVVVPKTIWAHRSFSMTETGLWHGMVRITKGKQYRYSVSGRVTLPSGQILDYSNVKMNIGTEENMVQDDREQERNHLRGVKTILGPAQESGSGVAPRDGKIWFTIHYPSWKCSGAIDVSVDVEQ